MVIKIDFTKIANTKVIIYAATAKFIFKECFDKAARLKINDRSLNGIENVENKNELLAMILHQVVLDSPIIKSFLSNKNKEIEDKLKKDGKYALIGFDHHYILTLAKFVDINDYTYLDKQNGPISNVPVLFNTKPFAIFSFIRIPQHGYLKEIGMEWELSVNGQKEIYGNVNAVELFTMPGDRHPFWIAVTYHAKKIYFAPDHGQQMRPVSQTDQLFCFFKMLLVSA